MVRLLPTDLCTNFPDMKTSNMKMKVQSVAKTVKTFANKAAFAAAILLILIGITANQIGFGGLIITAVGIIALALVTEHVFFSIAQETEKSKSTRKVSKASGKKFTEYDFSNESGFQHNKG
jgi:uncharacterized membrane protein YkvI